MPQRPDDADLPATPGSAGPGRWLIGALFAVQAWTATYLAALRLRATAQGIVGPLRYNAPFYQLIALVDWAGAVLNLAALAAAFGIRAGSRLWPRIDGIAAALGRHTAWVAIAVTGLLALATVTVHHGTPLVMDEHAPVFQAKILARGRLVGHWPPELTALLVTPETRQFLITSSLTGEVCSNYRPGFALFLTPFVWLGVPWACNPLLAGGSVCLIAAIARRLWAASAAGWAVIFTLGSPCFWAYGMSFYSMTAHLTCNLLYTLLLLDPTLPRVAAAGLVGGVALQLHNPFPHFLFALPWIAAVAFAPGRLVRLAVLGSCYAVVFIPVEARWSAVVHAVRTDRAVETQGAAQAPTPRSGQGLQSQPQASGPATATPPPPARGLAPLVGSLVSRVWGFIGEVRGAFKLLPAWEILLLRYSSAVKLVAWDAPGLVVLACLGGWYGRDRRPARLLAASGLVTFCGYALVAMSGGHGWGYRYFFSTWGVLPLLAAGLAVVPGGGWRLLLCRAGLAALVALGAILPVRLWQIHGFIGAQLAQRPPRPAVEPAAPGYVVSFLDPRKGWFRDDLIRNEPFLDRGPSYLVSQGLARDVLVVEELAAKAGMVYDNTYTGPEGSTWVITPGSAPR